MQIVRILQLSKWCFDVLFFNSYLKMTFLQFCCFFRSTENTTEQLAAEILELQTNLRENFTIRAFSWLKDLTNAFIFFLEFMLNRRINKVSKCEIRHRRKYHHIKTTSGLKNLCHPNPFMNKIFSVIVKTSQMLMESATKFPPENDV